MRSHLKNKEEMRQFNLSIYEASKMSKLIQQHNDIEGVSNNAQPSEKMRSLPKKI
jgi:hypothetical protein